MLVLSCLLLATSALAADYAPYMHLQAPASAPQYAPKQSAYPMDYQDNIHQRIKPGARFTYNFEQTRRNQPPQVVTGEEDLGRYMYRNHQTTTTAAPTPSFEELPVQVAEVNRDQPKEQSPQRNVPMTRQPENHQAQNQYQAWNNAPMVEARPPPPPPPALKWQEQDFKPASNWSPYKSQVVPTPAPIQWSDPSKPHLFLSRGSEEVAPQQLGVPQWAEKAPESHVHQQLQQVAHNRSQSPHNRGSQKFSLGDLASEPMRATTSLPVPRPNVNVTREQTQPMGPPPPPPTLSDWYGDNFGK